MNDLGDWDGQRRPILKSVRGWFKRSKRPSSKEKILMSSYLLGATLKKLIHLSSGLKRRDKRFFDKCIEAEMSRNHKRAVLYANECAEVRKLARLVISSELALEQAILRLKTINEVGNIMKTVSPILGIIQETKGRLNGIIPSIANKLGEVNSILTSSINEMGSAPSSKVESTDRDAVRRMEKADVIRILEEANVAAEERVREKFPELPHEFESLKVLAESQIPVALAEASANIKVGGRDLLKRQVYDYIKRCDGRLSIVQCASSFGVFPQDVEDVISELKNERKVILK